MTSNRLSAEDRALWAAVAQRFRPLKGRAMPSPPAMAPPPTVSPPPPPPPPQPRAAPQPVAVGEQPAGLDTRRWRELRRGRLRPERSLDLHGRFAQEAHGAVRAFLTQALADGVRCVCIITGKGSGEGGVLRRELPHWLNGPGLRGQVLAAAHPHRANTGSVHLLLRRARP
ncbi:MAG: Smr/MutS family protein [Rubritepida sp.]|nr:Smr/MutS family protein [Rubritepida sp.]